LKVNELKKTSLKYYKKKFFLGLSQTERPQFRKSLAMG